MPLLRGLPGRSEQGGRVTWREGPESEGGEGRLGEGQGKRSDSRIYNRYYAEGVRERAHSYDF